VKLKTIAEVVEFLSFKILIQLLSKARFFATPEELHHRATCVLCFRGSKSVCLYATRL